MMGRRHECKSFDTFLKYQERVCRFCGRRQYHYILPGQVAAWHPEITMRRFVESWCPAVSGTEPETMLRVRIAFPFEFRCYESWGMAFKVTFAFEGVTRRNEGGLGTPVDVMNGWSSTWASHWNEIDRQARAYFKERTGRDLMPGDNTYAEMRAVIQS